MQIITLLVGMSAVALLIYYVYILMKGDES